MSERTVFSMRAGRETLRTLSEEARRYRVPPRTLAEDILEEGLKMRRHPGIVFIERGGGRDSVLAGRPRLSIWQIVETARVSRSRASAARYLDLDVPSLERALAYAADYPDEIELAIRENDEAMERAMRLYPSAPTPKGATLKPARSRQLRSKRAAPSR